MPILLSNEYLSVTIDPDAPIVRTVRLERTFPTDDLFVAAHEEVVRALAGIERRRYAHMLDLRRGPMNNDPRFEEATSRVRLLMIQDFAHLAVVTRTAAGALQIARLGRQGSISLPVFQDAEVAVSYLKAALAGKPLARSGASPTPTPWPPATGRSLKMP